MADNPFTEGSLPHVFVQKGEHIGLPDVYSEMKEVMPSVNRLPDGRIYLQTMHSTDPLATGVQQFARRERVVVLGVNEEDRRRDAVNGRKKPLSQRRRAIKAVAGAGEDDDRPQVRFPFG